MGCRLRRMNRISPVQFHEAVLGYADRPDSPQDLIDPRRRGPLEISAPAFGRAASGQISVTAVLAQCAVSIT